jgi:acyl-coenzyme A synthetase/AMP-(fatty) acid ligase
VLAPLAAGARLVLADEAAADDLFDLRDLIHETTPTVVECDAATWHGLIEQGLETPHPRVWLRGPALDPELAAALTADGGEAWLSTPLAAAAGMGLLRPLSADACEASLGRPAPGLRVRIVDAAGLDAPVGVPGALLCATDGSDRFTASGQTAAWCADGTLRWCGREDGLVPAHGGWAHPQTLERLLASLPEVSEAHVETRRGGVGDPRLVAWISWADTVPLTSTELRERLRQAAPGSALPGVFVSVHELPRAEHGAVQSRALRDPFASSAAAFEAPAPGMESLLAGIWQDVLGTERVSAHDNFSELGGTSLLALRVIHEVQRRTGWQLGPRLLFFQTLRQIAERAPRGAVAA